MKRKNKNKIMIIKNKILLGFVFVLLSILFSNKSEAALTCDSGTIDDTCVISTAKNLAEGDTAITGTGTIQINNGGSIVGYLGQATTITIANLTINSGGYINFDGKGSTGGTFYASGSGSGGGTGISSVSGAGGGYGGAGGNSGNGTGGGIEYGQDVLNAPVALGSGGAGGFSTGGNGGGAIKLVISGTLTLNSGGYITANGTAGSDATFSVPSGGGSGGSIWIIAGTITGSGTIRSNGGNGGTTAVTVFGGGGAGGRIALTYETDNSSNFTKIAYGGSGNQYGSAGSVYSKQNSATYGNLVLNNNGQTSRTRTITSAYTVQDFQNFTFSEGSAGFVINSGVNLNIYGSSALTFGGAFTNNGAFNANSVSTLTFTGSFTNNSSFSASSVTSLTFSNAFNNSTNDTFNLGAVSALTFPNTFTNSGTINFPSSLLTLTFSGTNSNTGTITANNLATLNVNGASTNSGTFSTTSLDNLNIGASMTVNPGRYTFASDVNVTINSGGNLTHSANTTARTYYIDLTLGNLTINSGGYINLDGKGNAGGASYTNGSGSGGGMASASASGAGGGYGGAGGNSSTGSGGGVEYDQGILNAPVALGSGGAGGYLAGGAGGGAIKLTISGVLTLNSGGYITANGIAGSGADYSVPAGGGSGGSIWIIAGNITGSGTIRANGGNGGSASAIGAYGGGGAGGRIALIFTKGNSYGLTNTATGGSSSGYSGSIGSIYYNLQATYLSEVIDFDPIIEYTTLSYNNNVPVGATMTIDLHSGDTATPDGTWASWLTNLSSGVDISSFGDNRYSQYRVNLATTNTNESPKPYNPPTGNPTLEDISINFRAYRPATITSSAYDTSDNANSVASLTWNETLQTGTNIRFQLQTSPDNVTWTDLVGPDGTTDTYFDDTSTGCSKTGDDVTCIIDSGISIGDYTDDRYMRYRAYLSPNSTNIPTLNSVQITYVVNAQPELQNITASQGEDGLVTIAYETRDIDSLSGNNTPGNTVVPSFEYWNGSAWVECTTLSAGATDAVDVSSQDWVSVSGVTWNAKTDFNNHYQNSSTAKIRVTVNDGEAANYTANAESSTYELDTTPPDAGAEPIEVHADATSDNIILSATDNLSFQVRLAQGADNATCLTNLNNETYYDYSSPYTKTINQDNDERVLCVQYKDARSNSSTPEYLSLLEYPESIMIQDTSNVLFEPNEYRLFIAWKVIGIPLDGFSKYEIYRSSDGSNFSYLDEITDRTTNYYGDSTVEYNTTYYYKVKAISADGNISFYSNAVNGNANGVQDAGEGGGGTETTPPVITSVTSTGVYTSQATITWDTDELANSMVGYSAISGDFTNKKGTTTMVNNSDGIGGHSITLTGLDPNTTYYFNVESTDANENTQTEDNGGGGFQFTTQAGPVISENSVAISDITNNSSVVTWRTDVDAESQVIYADNLNFTNAVTLSNTNAAYDSENDNYLHTVNMTGLTGGVTYYLYVKSGVAIDNDAGDFYNFETTTDITAPVITFNSAVDVSHITDSSARIYWETNEPAVSRVEYGTVSDSLTESVLNPHYNTSHFIELTGLERGTTYYFQLVSTDGNSNSATDDNSPIGYYSLTTTDSTDSTPPVITFNATTGISNKTDTTARISWTTNEITTSRIDYGTSVDNLNEVATNASYNTNNYLELTSLTPETTYYFSIRSTDAGSNATTDDNSGNYYSFTTLAEGDYSGPGITGVIIKNLTYNSVTVEWETDEAGNSLVDYGTTLEYGNTYGNFSESTDLHSVVLRSLSPSTNYYCRVRSIDGDNNITTDDNSGAGYTFTTLSGSVDSDSDGEGDQLSDISSQIQDMIDTYAFTEQEVKDALAGLYSISITSSGPSVSITDTTAEISWNTNRPTIGKISYWQDSDGEDTKTTVSESATAATTSHTVTIKNLNANTKYNFYATSSGLLNSEIQSDTKSFSTEDTPTISAISISEVLIDSAKIAWATSNAIKSSELEYGTSTKYGKTIKPSTASNISTVELTNLDENTTYHLRVTAVDENDETIVSDDYTFTTVSFPVISNVEVDDITIETATITWQTNVKTDSKVEFIKDKEEKGTSVGQLELVNDHEYKLINLYPGSKYSFKVSSTDSFGNQSKSEDYTFTTLEDINPPTISNVKSETTVFPGKEARVQTIISWITDKDSTSRIVYREGVEKDLQIEEKLKDPEVESIEGWKLLKKDVLSKSHIFVMTDFKPGSVYQFKAVSFDKRNNYSISDTYSLLTPTKQQSVFDLIVKNFENTFGWMKGIGR